MARFDAALVGGGPAGAWAAYLLAAGGARVAIVDGSHPREKPCGGGLTGRALEIVRPSGALDSLPSVSIRGASFEYGGQRTRFDLQPRGDTPELVVAARRDFDGRLLGAAIRRGATHVPARVVGITRTPGGWQVHTSRGPIACGWLLGADGANSLVRRRVFRPFRRMDLSIAAGYFIPGVTASEVLLSLEASPAGYVWSFPRPDHLAVGICAQADESTASALKSRMDEWLPQRLPPGAEPIRYGWPIPSLGEQALAEEQSSGDRWMLLGDAAGLVDSITREGIFFALRSGELAASSMLAGTDPASSYSERLADEVHAELRRAARLKARFYRPHFMHLLIVALERSAQIRGVMSDLIAGRQTYRGLRRRLLRTLEVRLMLELFAGLRPPAAR
jgi:geranylgeranyl diphosphate/geranylgeranyl-bacteriochlorophyllide a reductase